jgi:hypothetical protein
MVSSNFAQRLCAVVLSVIQAAHLQAQSGSNPKATSMTLARIYQSLQPSPKSAFESDADYKKRVAGRVDTTKAYRVHIQKGVERCGATWNYDPETEKWVGTLHTAEFDFNFTDVGKRTWYHYPLECVSQPLGRYTASNAFGAKVVVERSLDTFFELGWHLGSDFEFPMTKSEAAKRAATLTLYLEFHPKVLANGLATSSSNDSLEPDIKTPYEMQIRNYVVLARDVTLVLVDSRTQTTLGRFELPSCYQPASPSQYGPSDCELEKAAQDSVTSETIRHLP